MSLNKLELRIAKITEFLGTGIYASEDVFTQENITILLSGKQVMNYLRLPIDSLIYVEIGYIDNNARGRFIYSYRNLMSDDKRVIPLDEQKKVLDAQFIECFGADKLKIINNYVYR